MSWVCGIKGVFSHNKNYLVVLLVFLTILLFSSPVFGFRSMPSYETSRTQSQQESPFVSAESSSTIYFISEGKKHIVDDPAVLGDFSRLGPVRTVDQSYLDELSFGNVMSPVVGSTDGSDMYLIVAGIRLRFNSCDSVEDYGFSCTGLIKLTPEQLASFHGGPGVTPFLKGTSNATVYFVVDGYKRPIASWGDLVGLGVPFVINKLTDDFVDVVPKGDLLLGGGGLIKTANSASVYAVNEWSGSPSVYPVASFNDTLDLGLGNSSRVVSNSQFLQYSIESNLKRTIKCGSTTYVGASGVLYEIDPSLYSHYNYSTGSFLNGGSICNRFTFSQTPMSRFILNRGSIYFVDSGVKRGFTSYRAYLENGGNPASTIPVSNAFADQLPNGTPIQPTTPRGEYEIKNDIYNRVNAERAARGLPALGWNSYLNNNARNWSVHMANTNSFAHSNLYPLLDHFYVAAENIGLAGAGARSGALHIAWMNSTGHRVNLLGRNLDVIGIGVYCAPDGRMWVTQQFGRWPNSALPTTFGPTPSANPIVKNDGGGATC